MAASLSGGLRSGSENETAIENERKRILNWLVRRARTFAETHFSQICGAVGRMVSGCLDGAGSLEYSFTSSNEPNKPTNALSRREGHRRREEISRDETDR